MAFLQRLLITNYSYSDREKKNDNAILLSYLTVLLNINRRESGIEPTKKPNESHSNPRLFLSFALSFRTPLILSVCGATRIASM